MAKIFKAFVYIFAIIGFLLVFGYVAIKLGITNDRGLVDRQRYTLVKDNSWKETEEWKALEIALVNDADIIKKVSKETDINERILISPLIVEQLRLYNSDREIFKKIFEPLKILGIQNQFSWGIYGIKEDTAKKIEANLKDPKSPWYLGKEFESILDYKSNVDIDSQRFERLTDERDRYYSYLYAGIYLKQIMTQWKNKGYDIGDRVDILATLFNIGFSHSIPNANPKSGGGEIEINKTTYSFGGLAGSFYDSDELTEIFGRKNSVGNHQEIQ